MSARTGFDLHGIDHLSASSINEFAAEPALWVMTRLLKRWGSPSSTAHRGLAIEDGVTHALRNPTAPMEECVKVALDSFDRRAALSGDARRMKHREQVAPTTERAATELRQYGVPDKIQTRFEVSIEGIHVPLHGILDFGWTQHGIILDLKTSERVASTISAAHARQGCIYVYNSNTQMRFCYAAPQKLCVYVLENPSEHVVALQQIAARMERFLRISSDPHELAALIAPNYDDFRWNDPSQRAVGREIFGF